MFYFQLFHGCPVVPQGQVNHRAVRVQGLQEGQDTGEDRERTGEQSSGNVHSFYDQGSCNSILYYQM